MKYWYYTIKTSYERNGPLGDSKSTERYFPWVWLKLLFYFNTKCTYSRVNEVQVL